MLPAFIGVVLIFIPGPDWMAVAGAVLLVTTAFVLAGLSLIRVFVVPSIRTPMRDPSEEGHLANPGLSVEAIEFEDPYEAFATHSVTEAFADEPKEYIENYLSQLNESWRSLTALIGRTATYLIVLMLLFYLLTLPGAVSHIGLGPFEIDDVSLVEKLIPVFTSYLFYELTLMGIAWSDSRRLFRLLMHRQHPGVLDANLELLIQPRMRAVVGQTEQWYPILGKRLRADKLHAEVFGKIVPFVVSFLVPIAFQVAASGYLLRRSLDPVTVAATIVSTSILLLTLTLFRVVEEPLIPTPEVS
jgi:hypothetical protein